MDKKRISASERGRAASRATGGISLYRAMYPMWMWRCAVALPRPDAVGALLPARAEPAPGDGADAPGNSRVGVVDGA